MSRVQRLFFRFLSSLRHPSVIAGFSLTSLPLRPEIRIRAEHNLPPFDPRRELRTFRESFVFQRVSSKNGKNWEGNFLFHRRVSILSIRSYQQSRDTLARRYE